MVHSIFHRLPPSASCLALLITSSLSASWYSGELRYDGLFKQDIKSQAGVVAVQPSPDRLELVRLKLCYNHLFHDNRYYAKFSLTSEEGDVFQIKNDVFNQKAFLSPNLFIGEASIAVKHQGLVMSYGHIETPRITEEHDVFQLGIAERVGTLLGRGGYKIGASAQFQQRALGTHVALWRQTAQQVPTSITPIEEVVTPSQLLGPESQLVTNLDAAEVSRSITADDYVDQQIGAEYGWGGRVAYTPYYNPYRALGFAVGFRGAPLDKPVVMGVLYQRYEADDLANNIPAQGFYRVLTFSRLQELRLDMLRTYEGLCFKVGASFQRLPVDKKASVVTNNNNAGAPLVPTDDFFIFEETGRSFGYYAEASYLIGASGYHVSRASSSVTGVRSPGAYGALEFGMRLGLERYTNALALMQQSGASDWTASRYETAPGVVVSGQNRLSFESVSRGDKSYNYIGVDNSMPDNQSSYVVPQRKEETSLFGLGQKKQVVYSYKTYAKGLSLHLNYYYNEDLRLQLQFESLQYQKNVVSQDPGAVDSLKYQQITQWKLRLESAF